jgi:hypothetical protein
MILFQELQHLPGDVPPILTLTSMIQGCSFEDHYFRSAIEMYCVEHVGCEEWQDELKGMFSEVMVLMCQLLEFVTLAIEDAEMEWKQREESEVNTIKAEWDPGLSSDLSMDDHHLSWLVLVNSFLF